MHRDYACAQEYDEMPTLEYHAMAPASAAAQDSLHALTLGGGTGLNRPWLCLGFLPTDLLASNEISPLLF